MGWPIQRQAALALLNAIRWRRFYAHAIPVLCYHAIPSRRTFEMQMACIRECGWTVVGLRDVIGWIARQKTPKPPAIVLTFDDCYTTQFTNAVPVLTQFGYPATFFAVSGRIGQHSDWDGPKGGTLSLMGRGELLQLRKCGFDVGCHSRTHPKLSDIPTELQKMEIGGGKREIENILGEEVWCFSYPYGNHTPALVDIVKECGFSAAVSVQVGAVLMNDNPFTLKRLCVPVKASNEELVAQFTWIPRMAKIVRRVPHLDVLARKLWTSS
jgi:peptidoglycan/xylan/chitin deacetylase (PgdA/CDA1 family)